MTIPPASLRSHPIVRRAMAVAGNGSETAVRFARFLLVGGSGVIVQGAILHVLVGNLRLDPTVSNLGAAAVAIFSNFNLNNAWTFGDERARGVDGYLRKLAGFYATSAVGVVAIQTGAIFAGDLLFGKAFYLEYFLIGTAILLAYNFSVYRLVIWRTEPGG